MSYFPMFIDLGGRKCLVIGGGKVASRKIRVLKDFGADVFVVAPDIIDEIKEITDVRRFIGCAPLQTEKFLDEYVRPVLEANEKGDDSDIEIKV